MAEGPDGALWVAVEGQGVYERKPAASAFALHMHSGDDPQSFASWVPSAVLFDRRGRLWVGTKDAGLEMAATPASSPLRFSHHRHDTKNALSLAHDEVWGLAESASGDLWVATYGGGVDVLDHRTGTFRHYRHDEANPRSLGSDLVTSVFVDRSGGIWVGTDGTGLQRYDPATDGFRALRHDARDPGSLSQDVIRVMAGDRQGQLWVGTFLGGVNALRTSRPGFGYFSHEPAESSSLADANVVSFAEDAQGRVWVGAAAGWLHLYERQRGSFTRHMLQPALTGALSLLVDRRGRLWVGSYRAGLGRFEPGRGIVALYRHQAGDPTSLANDEIWRIAEDDAGALWLATNDGLDRFDPDRGVVTAHFDTPSAEGPGNSGVRALLFDRGQTLWVGTITGLFRLAPGAKGLVRVRPADRALSHDGVVSLHEDRQGRLWAGTLGGGLKRIDLAARELPTYKDFPSNVIYGVEEDSSGRLWLSTNQGLVRFDPATQHVDSFDLSNGLQSLQFNLGVSLRLHDGHLLFGSVDGFYDLEADAIKPDTFVPPVVLTAARVFNEPLAMAAAPSSVETITLSPRDKVLSLEFAALDFALPRHNEYSYLLEGFNDQWLMLGSKREVTFTNLNPGSYVFRVKASNQDRIWSPAAPALLRLVVTPPVWGTWWFRLSSLALVMLALLTTHRFRVRRLTHDLVERKRSELALRRSEEAVRRTVSVLQSTLESTADGILVVDRGGQVVSFNQRFAELWNLPPEAVALSDHEILLDYLLHQVRQADPFTERVRQIETESDAESFDLLELLDGRVFERYSLPHRLDGAAVGRVWSFRDITERRRAEETIAYQAYHDALTGLPNRLLLEDRLGLDLVRARRHGHNLAVLFFDLDHFKLINDTLGHAAGDRLLTSVAERLKQTLRLEDTVARLGGDEFTLLLTELAHPDDAARMAEKLLDAFSLPFAIDGQELYVTASMGIAQFPNDGEDPDTLLRNADSAMYRAKEAGRNNYQLCTPGMNVRALKRMTLERELRRALGRDELVVHYQPLVNLGTGAIVGVEALVRWNHPDQGIMLPATFMAVAEESRLIVPLGEWVLHTACRQLWAWHAEGFDSLRMAVNLSARQLQQPNLTNLVEAALDENRVPAASLELEITESTAMQNVDWSKKTLRTLRDMGLRISIDDFGTGQSSFAYLKHFPLSTLKIDRSFVGDIGVDADDEAIVRAVIALAHILKLSVVAEGVENEKQLAFLREAGCEEGQGHLFSEALPAAAIQQLLDASRAKANVGLEPQ
jgi:diguanylate cyclase (GGDEF)-like protein/PAS domain S-box-containing protein